ncbi:STAS domain-containing protein [Maritimibacter sp. HL-12]|jgi:anti-sigma B factor antagonist|uniref:STAS domain-containing protein n=1 Tax=Maritimibacter sp. HL-12 TaxID=1162418 RepID=UPI000A0EF6A7|nr:STAS domain-containing protein [Maritimibacter sp. HL-12]SMH43323.1 anti-sigma B factor antagonist [Maritimibacter sp. HL-12]
MELVCHDSTELRVIEVAESRIDAAVAIQFKDRMRTLSDDGPMRVILDLSRVTFLDSSGLGAVVAAMKQMGSGRRLELAGLTPTVAKVFRLTRMDTVFTIHPDLAPFEAGLGHAR